MKYQLNNAAGRGEPTAGPRATHRVAHTILFILLAAALMLPGALAQEPVPTGGTSLPEVVEAIQRAANPVRVLYIVAHPDDEGGMVGALAYLSRGLGAEVALLSLTRGEGGQNALGPEQAPQLGVLRSEELLAATEQYGVKLLFTRAPDFGFSKSPEEAMKVWGDAVRKDMLQILEEEFCPDIVINSWGGVRTGHGQHQASGILADQVFAEASRTGTRCIPGKLLHVRRGDGAQGWQVPADEISPLWGKSYNEIGAGGFANHRTQGVVGFRLAAFLRRRPALGSQGDAKIAAGDFRGTLTGITSTNPHLGEALPLAETALTAARQAALNADWRTATRQLAAAGRALDDTLKYFRDEQSGTLEYSDSAEERIGAALLRQKKKLDHALALAAALQLRAQSDRAEIVAGERFGVRIDLQQRAGMEMKLAPPSLLLPAGWQAVNEKTEQGEAARFTVTIPNNAKPPVNGMDWMHAFPPPLVTASMAAEIDGYKFTATAPVVAERITSTRVDALPVTLVPAVTLTPQPRQFVVPANGRRAPKRLSMELRVRHYGANAAEITAGVEAPRGWSVTPPVALKFEGAGDQLVRFDVTLSPSAEPGSYPLKPFARRGMETFSTSLEPLPTLPTRLWSEPAMANVRVFDLNVPRDLRVGYIAAENDPIPEALRQVGVRVEMLDEGALAFGDLSRFDAIAVGVRAYELRGDVIRANKRLLDYAAAGGTLVVQYQRDSDWNRLRPAPYPAAINPRATPGAQGGSAQGRIRPERITDENSPVKILKPAHPALNFPNAIRAGDYSGWVQERGLYFWTEFDARYEPLLAMRDPTDSEDATGGLVFTRHGKGVYIYTGLAFFRQLPAGVPGAYRLFINLLSQSKGTVRASAASQR